jgi:hypothetical protein
MKIGKLYTFNHLDTNDYMLIYDKRPYLDDANVIDEIHHGNLAVVLEISKDVFGDPLLKILKQDGTIGWVMCHPLFYDWKEVEE